MKERRKSVVLYCLSFVLILGLLRAVLDMLAPYQWQSISDWTAYGAGWLLSLFGAKAEVRGAVIVGSSSELTIIRECTALHPLTIYLAAVLAFPHSWKAKAIGCGLGSLLLLAINQVRLASLAVIAGRWPGSLEIAHMVVWQSLMVFAAISLWGIWAVAASHGRFFPRRITTPLR